MSEPLVVIIPHRLGKDEALRRIKDGLTRAREEFARLITLEEERWEGDRLSFKAQLVRPARASAPSTSTRPACGWR